MLHNSNEKISSRDKKDHWFCLMGTDDYEAGRFGYVSPSLGLEHKFFEIDYRSFGVIQN